MLSWKEYCEAAKELSPSALKLYMYLAKNKDGYEFFFSSKDFIETFDISDKSYRNAKNELIEKGYLKEEENNKVNFSSNAAFKETRESLAKELSNIGRVLKEYDEDAFLKVYEILEKEKPNQIKDDNLYKIKIKEIISFARDLMNEFVDRDFNKFL